MDFQIKTLARKVNVLVSCWKRTPLREASVWKKRSVILKVFFYCHHDGHNGDFISGLSPSLTPQSGLTYLLGRGNTMCALSHSPHILIS